LRRGQGGGGEFLPARKDDGVDGEAEEVKERVDDGIGVIKEG
jgi:hypothetical protein